ncbi:MAG: hypothetical protein COZ08_11665 [Bacteroidetes bacterium CG_4_10_14_3_um_filter_42_6]|nr:MAG: hypothetical protein COZ08_11665 [Bacteroidetes bacterium CG_4_10_14_3_um_filter_42_6]
MTDQEKFDLVARLGTKIEVLGQRFTDWTIQHDKHSAERHADTKEDIKKLFDKFDEVPCRNACKNDKTITILQGLIIGIILAIAGAYFKAR